MYSTYNEGKSVFTERSIITLKNRIYKSLTSISKNVYTDKLNDIVNKYNNTYHKAIKMKPVNVKSNTHTDSSKEINGKGPKIRVSGIVITLKYKSFLKRFTLQIGLKKFLWLQMLRILCHGHISLMILMEKKLLELFIKKNCKEKRKEKKKKENQKMFRIEKVIKRNSDILYSKWKGYNNSFNIWISKKRDSIIEWISSETIFFRSKFKCWLRFV